MMAIATDEPPQAIPDVAVEDQTRPGPVEPARVFQFRAIDDDILVVASAVHPIISDEG